MTKTVGLFVSPYENLKGFAISRPPVIIFMVCIALISIILMTLAFIVKDNELKKPDVSQVKSSIQFSLYYNGRFLMWVLTTIYNIKI